MKRRGYALAGLVLLSAIVVGFFISHDVVRARDARGRTLFEAPLPPGSEFGIRFIHSVALSPVEEWFCAENGQVRLNRTVYQDFGAGLPHEAASGQKMIFQDGRIIISGFTLVLPRVEVRVGRVARHHLLVPENSAVREIALTTLVPPGEALAFSVHTQSLIGALWQRLAGIRR